MSDTPFNEKVQYLNQLVSRGFHASEQAVEIIKDLDKHNPLQNSLVLHYLSIANTAFNSFSVYSRSDDELIRDEFIEAVAWFEIFHDEVVTNIATNNSHQHSFIYFEDFKKKLYPALQTLGSSIALKL
ncbi:hypothetical protein [Kurthia sp. Dielmo]|uniref:hypothetical protein n=1 Tax=Kurthia sp. Dielmo TaxID=1033738 RepID=UPI00111E74FE|nr:hypothetical protein [Kurthia sp. Dielmo]